MGGEDTTTTTTTTTTNEGGGARPPRVKGVRVVRAVCDGVNTVLRACEEQLNEVNERYSFELNPEYRIKMKKRIGHTSVGMRFDVHARRYLLSVKSNARNDEYDDVDGDQVELEDKKPLFWRVMKKIQIEPEEKKVEAFTQRVTYGPLSLRGVGEFDGTTNEWGIRWQLQTFHQEKKGLRTADWEFSERAKGCLRWDVSSVAPEVEGKLASGERFSFDIDVGSYHVTVPRIELKVDL